MRWAPRPPPHYRLSANDYFNLTLPPSVCRGGPLDPYAKGAPCRGDRDSLNLGAYFWNVCFRHRVGRRLDLSGSGHGQVVGSCVLSNEPSVLIKMRGLLWLFWKVLVSLEGICFVELVNTLKSRGCIKVCLFLQR